MSSFGERFKSIRLAMGLTQEELTEDFNNKYGYAFSKTTISQYENNRRIPEMNTLKKFAEYFTVSFDYLVCNDFANVNDIILPKVNVSGKYVELKDAVELIKSLANEGLLKFNGDDLSEENKRILTNGLEVVLGIINKSE